MLEKDKERENKMLQKSEQGLWLNIMSSTSVTAFIVTFHNASALSILFLALLISVPVFLLFFRKTEKRGTFFLITFLCALLFGYLMFDRAFHLKPVGVEIVQAG